jgi:hypothetical protein
MLRRHKQHKQQAGLTTCMQQSTGRSNQAQHEAETHAAPNNSQLPLCADKTTDKTRSHADC